jgi:hypothetical protein
LLLCVLPLLAAALPLAALLPFVAALPLAVADLFAEEEPLVAGCLMAEEPLALEPFLELEGSGAAVCFVSSSLDAARALCRWLRAERPVAAGSAMCRRLPAATLTPVRWFQVRNCSRETPKRSAMVTSVSPLRAV